jgi:toxin ParE1/3/4
MKVHWTAGAVADLSEICDYIAQDSPAAAARVAARLLEAVGRLGTFPRSAKEVFRSRNGIVRALAEPPYQVLYVIQEDSVVINAVVHGRRDLARLLSSMTERE